MQNENAGKTVEQIAADKYPIKQSNSIMDVAPNALAAIKQGAFIDGYTTAQQAQPMWREIEQDGEYDCCIVTSEEKRIKLIDYCADGEYLLRNGYTHYLSSEDLLRLPTEKK